MRAGRAATMFWLALPILVGAQPVPDGPEFRVNTYLRGYQSQPSVCRSLGGDFVVVWENREGSGDGIFAQRYSSTGAPEGGEFQVNTYTYALQRHPAVASAAAGDFVVVWESYCFRCHPEPFPCPPCVDQGIVGQRYDRTGAPRG